MGWNDIANNQAVTSTNLQNAVDIGKFTALTTFASSNNCVTKAEAVAWVNCWTGYSPLAAKSNDQLVVKSDLVTTTSTAGILAVIDMGYRIDAGDFYFTANVSSGSTSNNISFVGTFTTYFTTTCNSQYRTFTNINVTLSSGNTYVEQFLGIVSVDASFKITSMTAGGTALSSSPQTITVSGNQYQIYNFDACLTGA